MAQQGEGDAPLVAIAGHGGGFWVHPHNGTQLLDEITPLKGKRSLDRVLPMKV